MRFNLSTFFAVLIAIPVLMGFAAGMEELALLGADSLFSYIDKTSNYHAIVNAGVPIWFVANYYALATYHFPGWCCLAGVSFFLGLIRSGTAHFLLLILAVATAFSHAFLFFAGDPEFLLLPPLYVLCIAGATVVLLAGFIGWLLRGRTYEKAITIQSKLVKWGITVTALVTTLVLSSSGWRYLLLAQEIAATWDM